MQCGDADSVKETHHFSGAGVSMSRVIFVKPKPQRGVTLAKILNPNPHGYWTKKANVLSQKYSISPGRQNIFKIINDFQNISANFLF
jgi:hypothetical protein